MCVCVMGGYGWERRGGGGSRGVVQSGRSLFAAELYHMTRLNVPTNTPISYLPYFTMLFPYPCFIS